ncbi:GGDEF domain-containing protein [Agromyces atrinae]|uniref:Diguanylate cyclase (GGDEF)-like protein n=1 Tax=Agromyces atrinae TaxID=592376 RepID=A0A4Q2M600_9MICO|nr:GGDEF domain-containing protein [Agromyces atrinae]NYD66950.1 diguanylate cyclase (GGDEF)-like protein [Agromyces atrinae]RXZ87594.1 GGDEF domain-containing protein [Agromyces atrinae]
MIDLSTLTLVTAVVVVTVGLVFILDTLLWRDNRPGRIWSISFMSGMLTVFSYMLWSTDTAFWWAIAIGNGAFVLSIACLWSGARVFNGRNALLWVTAAAPAVAVVAVLIEGPQGGSWAGAFFELAGVSAFAVAAGVEMLRGRLGAIGYARITAVAFFTAGSFYIVRTIIFVAFGAGSPYFTTFFGSEAASFVTIVFVIIVGITMSVLRIDSSRVAAGSTRHYFEAASNGVLARDSFEWTVSVWLERAEFHDAQLAMMYVRVDDYSDIVDAYGRAVSDQLVEEWMGIVRRHAPPHSDIGEINEGELAIVSPMSSPAEARAAAEAIRSGLQSDSSPNGNVRATISIGVSLTDYVGFAYSSMLEAADAACERAQEDGGDREVVDTGLTNRA